MSGEGSQTDDVQQNSEQPQGQSISGRIDGNPQSSFSTPGNRDGSRALKKPSHVKDLMFFSNSSTLLVRSKKKDGGYSTEQSVNSSYSLIDNIQYRRQLDGKNFQRCPASYIWRNERPFDLSTPTSKSQ